MSSPIFMTSSAQNELTKGAKGSEEEAATAATRTAAGDAAVEAPAAVSRAPPPRLQSASSSQLESLHALQQGPTRPLQQQTELAPEQHQEAPPAAQRVLLTRRTLAELLLSRHQLLQLVPLELLLRGKQQAVSLTGVACPAEWFMLQLHTRATPALSGTSPDA